MQPSIPTYIINLKRRQDRYLHIKEQFKDKNEFNVQIIEAIQNDSGALGLWETLVYIIEKLVPCSAGYILIVEDDHQFTENYSREKLFEYIKEGQRNSADILSGGVSWFSNVLEVTSSLLWLEKFSGLQFTIVYKKFFEKIIRSQFSKSDVADYKISSLTTNAFCIYPFISIQKDFGYSDVTKKNNNIGRVETLYANSIIKIKTVKKVLSYYNNKRQDRPTPERTYLKTLPTYFITGLSKELSDHYINEQFTSRKEFVIKTVLSIKTNSYETDFCKCMAAIADNAITNNYEAIVICTDKHLFTKDYIPEFFLENVNEASKEGTEIIYFSADELKTIVPITKNRFATNEHCSQSFIVIFKQLFKKIQISDPSNEDTVGLLLSKIAATKVLLHPFVCTNSDWQTPVAQKKLIKANKRLEIVSKKFLLYKQFNG